MTTAFTGILLAFYYEPTAGGSYNSLKVSSTQIPYGWLVQRLHNIAGNAPLVVSLVEIVGINLPLLPYPFYIFTRQFVGGF